MMNLNQLLIFFLFLLSLSSCAQDSKYVLAFKGTEANNLAKAVEREDLSMIEKVIRANPSLIELVNPINGSNVLALSIDINKYRSFVKLLEFGANPNFFNPYTKYSILIDAIRPFGSQLDWKIDNRYLEELLKYGANPNYAVEEDFINEKGDYIIAKSPLTEASGLDLEAVKTLVKNGADPKLKIGSKQFTSFSKAIRRGNIEIVNYYIDSLGIDVHQPMSTEIRKPTNEKVTYYIQDFIVNKYIKAKIIGDTLEVERLKKQNKGIEDANKELWQLILKLEGMGIDFKNYEYKLK